MSYLVLFCSCVFSPFSIAITSLGEDRANLSAFRTFVWFVLVWFCWFPLPLGVWERLRFVIVALPGLFSYLFLVVFWCGYFWAILDSRDFPAAWEPLRPDGPGGGHSRASPLLERCWDRARWVFNQVSWCDFGLREFPRCFSTIEPVQAWWQHARGFHTYLSATEPHAE